MPLPTVAIVGRPNVGKSSLLNALARQQVSIVDPRPGVTRDRVGVVIEHAGRYFDAVDTGGIGIVDSDQLEEHVQQQIDFALAGADVIVFVVDVREGLASLDQHIAGILRKLSQPVVLAANKADDESHRPLAGEFHKLGFGEPLCISALHGSGREELLERLAALLPPDLGERPTVPLMHLAIVGKRNAGKSTLVNALAGEQRVIVSEVPGTTRDAVDVRFVKDGRQFVAIDTAGVRKKRMMQDIEFYSYTRATRSIRRADVVMLLIDSLVPVSEVDCKLAEYVAEQHKPVVIAVNKWDLALDKTTTGEYGEYLTKVLPHVDYAPIVFITAKDGKNVDAAVELALHLHQQAHTRVGTGQLNAALEAVLAARGPSAKRGTRPVKVYYATQVDVAPPTLVFFCNHAASVGQEYRRYMLNRLRELLPFAEVPMRLLFRDKRAGDARPSEDEPHKPRPVAARGSAPARRRTRRP